MRIKCPHCHERFDVGHKKVLEAAKLLQERAQRGDIPEDALDGNVLTPDDDQARKLRQEVIRKRLGNRL